MGTGFEHTALAVFTTLAPMGAGAFIALAYAFAVGKPDEEAARRLDRWTALPLAVLAAGFVGAFTHLASPLNAFGVFAGVGSSPLSNEVLAGVVFAALAVVYWVLALTGKLSAGARTGPLAVLSALAVVFAVFCGLAYMMYTIPTWNTPLSIVQMVGYLLAGGTVLGFCTVGCARTALPKGSGPSRSCWPAWCWVRQDSARRSPGLRVCATSGARLPTWCPQPGRFWGRSPRAASWAAR